MYICTYIYIIYIMFVCVSGNQPESRSNVSDKTNLSHNTDTKTYSDCNGVTNPLQQALQSHMNGSQVRMCVACSTSCGHSGWVARVVY